MKRGIFLTAIKGPKGMKMRANAHIPGVKPAKSSFGKVRTSSRVEGERKKLRKIHPKMSYTAPQKGPNKQKKSIFTPYNRAFYGRRHQVVCLT